MRARSSTRPGGAPVRIAARNKTGFTLIEVMVAVVIMAVGLLALLRVAIMSIDTNMTNSLRDEAVRIAEEQISTLRQTKYDNLTGQSNWPTTPTPITRKLRSADRTFYVATWVRDLDATPSAKIVSVAVGWDYKGSGSVGPTKRQYVHMASSVISRPPGT